MGMASTVREYLERKGIHYELIPHAYSTTSTFSAETAHIPGDKLAKSVVLKTDGGYLLAILPSTHHIDLDELQRQLNRRLDFASEDTIAALFNDCEYGAVPPLGEAYGVDMVVDDCLSPYTEVYFEAGDHRELVRVSGDDFERLMTGADHRHFTHHF